MTDCMDVQRLVWADHDAPTVRAHLEECEECRAESRRARQLRVGLAGLQAAVVLPPAGLEPALLTLAERRRFDRARELVYHPTFRRGAAVGAAAAATAAFGIILARRMLRPDLAV